MKKILMATDLSARSDRALQRAATIADETCAALEVIHIVDESLRETAAFQRESAARDVIAQQVGAIPFGGRLTISQKVIRGLDYNGIIQRAEEFGADLVVLGIPRHDAPQLFQGTTAERVVRYGTRPVLVVKDSVRGPYRRALVAVDLSTHAQAAIAMAARLVPGGKVHLVHAAHRQFTAFLDRDTQNQLIRDELARVAAVLDSSIQTLSSQLGPTAPRFEVVLREGEVSRVIREQVAALKPDFLAVGTHGRTGIAHAIIGSIAEDLLASAPVDVLAVKAT